MSRIEEVGPGTSMHMMRYRVFVDLHIHDLSVLPQGSEPYEG